MNSSPVDPNDDIEALRRRIAELEAGQRPTVDGSGSTRSVGAGGVHVGGQNTGTINTGTQVITEGGHFIAIALTERVSQIIHGGEDAEEAKSVIALYLYGLVADLAGLMLGEIDVSAMQAKLEPLQLADVYVPLDTRLRIPKEMKLTEWLLRNQRPLSGDAATQHQDRPVSALEALAAHRELTILGRPGSGKSTFGANVLLTLAQVWQGHRDELARLGDSWTHDVLLPIRVVLRRFADKLPVGSDAARAYDLWTFIGDDLEASGYGLSVDTMKYVTRLARSHGALILLDGLDECGNAAKQQRVLGAVQELMRIAGPKCRFLLTARPYAWPGGPDPARGVYALADFNDEQVKQFIRAWYAALVTRAWLAPGDAERKRGDFLEARQRPDLQPLACNPLLLTLMATLHANRGRLPDDRADLYNDSVDLLILRWNRQIGADKALLDELAMPGLKLSDLREVLEELAFNVHEDSLEGGAPASGGDPEPEGKTDIGEHQLVRAFRPLFNDSWDKAAMVVDYIDKRAGLLVGQGQKHGEPQFAFPHRTFQEFLAACYLFTRDDFAAECTRLARSAPSHWQVVLPLAARLAKVERGASAADALIGGRSIAEFRARRRPEAADWMCAFLAGTQLQEIGLSAIHKNEHTRAITERVADWLAASLSVHPDDGGLPAANRAQAGDLLAALGDARFDPQCFYLPADDLLGFVRIAADPHFRIGTPNSDLRRVAITGLQVPGEEINDAPTPAPDCYVARYPVTIAQFRAFVESTGFEIGDARALRDPDSRPVRFVSWHDALAYCDWLHEMLVTSPALQKSGLARLVRDSGWRVALPSELEWEKAARGGLSGPFFSWGETPNPNRANYADSGIGDTSAAGCFPANGFGLYDMIGNVFEWTRSRYAAYPYLADDGRENPTATATDCMVLRGGSFSVGPGLARCASRSWNPPVPRCGYIGFRVVLRSSPVS
ncbi:NACHT domain-containing protein [Caballeronia humi]|uniref:Serine/threonine kinase n=1 Tax=Caballeronia humi TaxID=326474 RepID=A0A158IUU4_9BURK|nr:SUMF1/EgtB/PvdO family nonheme iron enzyme [Caballeronia humi]SAL59860.1 serine/threonine kinase [Caballeronia humi]